MKINSALPTLSGTPDASRTRGPVEPQAAKPNAGTGARVDISPISVRLAGVGAGEAPVDAKRVAEIRQAIAEGRFQIRPERIADGLIGSVRELLDRAGRPS